MSCCPGSTDSREGALEDSGSVSITARVRFKTGEGDVSAGDVESLSNL